MAALPQPAVAIHLQSIAPAPVKPLFPNRSFQADESNTMLPAMALGIVEELQADGLLVTLHDNDVATELYATGTSKPADAIDALECASSVVRAAFAGRSNAWVGFDGYRRAFVSTAISTDRGFVAITAQYNSGSDETIARVRSAGKVLPLVEGFFRMWAQRWKAVSQLRGLTTAIDKSDVGILLVDQNATIVFANARAKTLIEEGDGVRCVGSRIYASRLPDTLRLQAAIEHVVTSASLAFLLPTSPVVALQRPSRRPIMAAVVADGWLAERTQDSVAIVYLFDPEEDLRPLLEPVCKLYGLSPVETKLACHLADGISIGTAAVRMRVREQTARSYLKQIFLKTDTKRQGELVWLMLKSSVRTAPACKSSLV